MDGNIASDSKDIFNVTKNKIKFVNITIEMVF